MRVGIFAIHRVLILTVFFSATLLLSSCGGGGGGSDDDFFGAGNVSLRIQPSSIDVGDRTLVTIDIDNVNPDGVLLKVRFPEALAFVNDSATLRIEGNDVAIVPDLNVSGDNSARYLVFFLNEADFDRNGSGVMRFQLQANESILDGRIGADIDVDDPEIDNSVEFDASSPAYQEESGASIQVIR